MILCPGPSLARLKTIKETGPVLAVNRAILRTDLPITYWIHLDKISNKVFRTMTESWESDVVKTLPPSIVSERHRELTSTMGYRLARSVPPNNKTINEILGLENCEARWLAYTVVGAMAWCAIDGAKHIHIYGADMGGNTYFDGTAMHAKSRWENEQRVIDPAVEALSKIDVKVEFLPVQ